MFETTVHWVQGIEPNRLGLMARPRGGDSLREEVSAWRNSSIGLVVSLLESHEIRELELREEPALCTEHGVEFRHFPIPDRGTPGSTKQFAALVSEVEALLLEGKSVAVHCRAGIGRTGVFAGAVLHRLRVPRSDIFHILSRSRGMAMPDTSSQVEWLEKYAREYPNAP